MSNWYIEDYNFPHFNIKNEEKHNFTYFKRRPIKEISMEDLPNGDVRQTIIYEPMKFCNWVPIVTDNKLNPDDLFDEWLERHLGEDE